MARGHPPARHPRSDRPPSRRPTENRRESSSSSHRLVNCRMREQMIARNESDQAPRGFRLTSGVKILRQKRGGPVASVQVGLPEEAGGDRAPRPPSLGERAQFAFKRTRLETKPVGYRDLQTKSGGRASTR